MDKQTEEIEALEKAILALRTNLVDEEYKNRALTSQLSRYKRALLGEKTYTPQKDIAIEIDCENYISQHPGSDGVRRHAFSAGANSILDKVI